MKIEIIVKNQFTQQEDRIDAGSIKNAKLITHHLGHDLYTLMITTSSGFHSFSGLNSWYFFSQAFPKYNQRTQELLTFN